MTKERKEGEKDIEKRHIGKLAGWRREWSGNNSTSGGGRGRKIRCGEVEWDTKERNECQASTLCKNSLPEGKIEQQDINCGERENCVLEQYLVKDFAEIG